MSDEMTEPLWFKRLVWTYVGGLVGIAVFVTVVSWVMSYSMTLFLAVVAVGALVVLFAGAAKAAPPGADDAE